MQNTVVCSSKTIIRSHVIQNKSRRHPLLSTSCKLESKFMLSAVKSPSTFSSLRNDISISWDAYWVIESTPNVNCFKGREKSIACSRSEVGIFEFARPRNTDHVIIDIHVNKVICNIRSPYLDIFIIFFFMKWQILIKSFLTVTQTGMRRKVHILADNLGRNRLN